MGYWGKRLRISTEAQRMGEQVRTCAQLRIWWREERRLGDIWHAHYTARLGEWLMENPRFPARVKRCHVFNFRDWKANGVPYDRDVWWWRPVWEDEDREAEGPRAPVDTSAVKRAAAKRRRQRRRARVKVP
jgi:hypothetical protein